MFRPRHNRKGSGGFLPLPSTGTKKLPSDLTKRGLLPIIVTIISGYLFFAYVFSPLFHWSFPIPKPKYPEPHPYTSSHIVETSNKYIFPPVEQAPLLKELGVDNLVFEFKYRDSNFPELERTRIKLYNSLDNDDPKVQKKKEEAENSSSELNKAKNMFKNQDKIVYKAKNGNSPKVVLVTAIDFEKYSTGALTKIVQNRIDYAYKQDYGVYVRWAQDMLPMLNLKSILSNKERAKWARFVCLRAAMFAFPESEWFWYLDQDSLVMNQNIDIVEYILKPELLDPAMLRDHSLVPPDGHIRTHKSLSAESVKLITVQSQRKLETMLFFVKNDHIGRSIVEGLTNPLYLNYQNFPYGPDSALTHLLQWHPFILSQTAVIPLRTVAAQHSAIELPPNNGKGGDHIHYYPGDLVAQWTDCSGLECEENVNSYFEAIKKV